MNFGKNMKEVEEPSLKNFETDKIETLQSQIHQERIKNAPKIVQDYYAGTAVKFEKGLFRVLVAKKQNRFIFFVMLFCLVISFIYGTLSGKSNIKVVSGYECELQAFSYDDTCYASVKIHPVKKTKKYLNSILKKQNETLNSKLEIPVNIEFLGLSSSGVQMKFSKEASGTIFAEPIILRTSTEDYDIIKVVAIVSILEQKEELVVKVIHKVQ